MAVLFDKHWYSNHDAANKPGPKPQTPKPSVASLIFLLRLVEVASQVASRKLSGRVLDIEASGSIFKV